MNREPAVDARSFAVGHVAVNRAQMVNVGSSVAAQGRAPVKRPVNVGSFAVDRVQDPAAAPEPVKTSSAADPDRGVEAEEADREDPAGIRWPGRR